MVPKLIHFRSCDARGFEFVAISCIMVFLAFLSYCEAMSSNAMANMNTAPVDAQMTSDSKAQEDMMIYEDARGHIFFSGKEVMHIFTCRLSFM